MAPLHSYLLPNLLATTTSLLNFAYEASCLLCGYEQVDPNSKLPDCFKTEQEATLAVPCVLLAEDFSTGYCSGITMP